MVLRALCTQRRRRARRDRRYCYFFVDHSTSPFVYPLAPIFQSLGKSVENAIRAGGGTSGSVYKATRGWLTGSPSNPPLCAPTPLPPLLPLVPVSDAVVEISKVRWCFSLAAHTISLYPSPQWPPPRLNSQSGAAFDMLRQHFLCSQRLNS